MSAAVTSFRLMRGRTEAFVRETALATDRVVFGLHARQQMSKRGIDDVDALRVLRTGGIVDEPRRAEPGEWLCKFVQRIRGGRDVGVVVIILRDKRLFIKTVEWEDVR